jgi:hypothetical protein
MAICPAQSSAAYHVFQTDTYRIGVLKEFNERIKIVKTTAGDTAWVVEGPKDGNCLPTALLRGLVSGGAPLSARQEHDGQQALRDALALQIREHTWPHEQIAAPQTIEQCIHDTETDGRWMGEVALAAFTIVSGTEVRLWRYVGDKKEGKVIEPIMSALNPGDGDARLVIHLLQTRDARPDQPEFNGHWEVLIMQPPSAAVTPAGLVFGPAEVKDGFTMYEWVEDKSRVTHLRVAPLMEVTLKGRGARGHTVRVIHQIRRRNEKSVVQVMVVGTRAGARSPSLAARSLTDVISAKEITGAALAKAMVDTAAVLLDRAAIDTKKSMVPKRVPKPSPKRKQIVTVSRPRTRTITYASSSSSSSDSDEPKEVPGPLLKRRKPTPIKPRVVVRTAPVASVASPVVTKPVAISVLPPAPADDMRARLALLEQRVAFLGTPVVTAAAHDTREVKAHPTATYVQHYPNNEVYPLETISNDYHEDLMHMRWARQLSTMQRELAHARAFRSTFQRDAGANSF